MDINSRNILVGTVAWLLGAFLCSILFGFAFELPVLRIFAGLVGMRIAINLLLLGGKEIYEGKNGGSRVI